MIQFKMKSLLILANLIYLTSEYKKVIKKSHKLTQEGNKNIDYLFFSNIDYNWIENYSTVKYPFNLFSIIKLDSFGFWNYVFYEEAFDNITNSISKILEKSSPDSHHKIFYYKLSNPKGVKFATVFANKEKISFSNVLEKKLYFDIEICDETKLREYLKVNFPQKNIITHEIIINDVVIELQWYQSTKEKPLYEFFPC